MAKTTTKRPGRPADPRLGELMGLFRDAWQRHYLAQWLPGGADPTNAKRWLTAVDSAGATVDLEEVKTVLKRYLADTSPYLVSVCHPMSLFFSQYPRWRQVKRKDPNAPQYRRLG